MPFSPIGADEVGNLPPKVSARLAAIFAPLARALPTGGNTGQVPVKTSNGVAWTTIAAAEESSVFARVLVVTGSEPRPDVDFVLWMGGASRPANMIEGDLWMEAPAAPDITAPSVPAGLASSAITTSGFTLTWSAASDAVAVTGYEVRLNSGAAIAVTGLSRAFTGLNSSTTYQAQVRARDAAGNWSAWSTALSVTTLVSTDTTAPTAPSGLVASGVNSTGFTVSWTASTDAVGVTGYEVFIGGVSYGTTTSLSQTVTGRTPATAHSVTVRARDAAGNWSPASSPLSVTTSAAPVTTNHSIWGSSVPGSGPQLMTDGAPGIILGQKFYTYGVSTGPGNLPNAKCVGGRVYLPAGHGQTALRVMGWENVDTSTGPGNGYLDFAGNPPTRDATIDITGLSGWAEVSWAPFSMSEGSNTLIAYRFPNAIGNYISAPGARPGNEYFRALDNSKLVWAEQLYGGKMFRLDGGPTQAPDGGASYSIDILVAES